MSNDSSTTKSTPSTPSTPASPTGNPQGNPTGSPSNKAHPVTSQPTGAGQFQDGEADSRGLGYGGRKE